MTQIIPLEHDEQRALFQWAAIHEYILPELASLYAIPNGGHRHIAVARKLKAEGVKAGVLDVNLDVARGGYHGLRIEMKRVKGGGLSPDQKEWIKRHKDNGYRAEMCRGWVAATVVIMEYLRGANA